MMQSHHNEFFESMVKYNFHTHSNFSDGSNNAEDYIIEAINQKFEGIGMSEHSVLPFENTFALQKENQEHYIHVLDKLIDEYCERIAIYRALEADYIPGVTESFLTLKKDFKLDYIIGSVHLVLDSADNRPFSPDRLWFIDGPKRESYDHGMNILYGGDARKAVTSYWHQINRMIEEESFDVIGHLDKIKMHNQERWFKEGAPWYKALWHETIKLIAEKNLLVEVNTRGIYKKRSNSFFPGPEILKELNKLGVGIVISSDAHAPNEISLLFEEALVTLKECGYSSNWIYNSSGWVERPFT